MDIHKDRKIQIAFLEFLGFNRQVYNPNLYSKKYAIYYDYVISIDISKQKIFYRDDDKLNTLDDKICLGDTTTSNFSHPENFVVLECVNRLLEKGYEPKDLYLEKRWKQRKTESLKADIQITGRDGKVLFIIECKTWRTEFDKEKNKMEENGGQLFSYLQQDKNAEFLCLYTSEFEFDKIQYENAIAKIQDREEDLEAFRKGDDSIKLYKFANNKTELHEVWKETFNLYFHYNGIFEDDVNAYSIELKPLKKRNLKKLKEPQKIFYQFLEILRHNNISDNANAFNRMLALFLCKIVDEEKSNNEILDFQVKEGEDDFEKIQDRLQKLYQKGMSQHLQEKIVYYEDKVIKDIINKYPKQTPLEEIERIFKEIKYYTNNEFAFKEVHNKELFEQNARILNEVIKLLQNYQFRYSKKQQFLGDFFELLLNHGVKQSEGQFFTPVPIVRFIILSLVIEEDIYQNLKNGKENFLPKILDYACGSGHFLTESIDEVQKILLDLDKTKYNDKIKKQIEKHKKSPEWAKESIFGIEKDYRLARTSQIACFLNGDGDANIIFGDGLEDHSRLKAEKRKFDIVIANPPYAVKSFKNYLNVGKKEFDLFSSLTEKSKEIETLFIERTKQVLKPGGKAGIILPSSILSNSGIYTKAREILFKYFEIKAIAELGSKTFIATGTNTVVLFLKRRNDNFQKDRKYIADDLILNKIERKRELDFIDSNKLLREFLKKRDLDFDNYQSMIKREANDKIQQSEIYQEYLNWFENLTEIKNLKRKRTFQNKTKDEQNKEINSLFYDKILKIEKDKFLYFMLCLQDGNYRGDENYYRSLKTVTVNMGNKIDEQKEFLGYEIIGRRGEEGLRVYKDENQRNMTRLFDDDDYENSEKANSYIRKSFLDSQNFEIQESLKNNIKWLKLVDMVNFEGMNFEKQINLNVESAMQIESKWELVKLGEKIDIKIGGTPSRDKKEYYENGKYLWVSISEMNGNVINDTKEKINDLGVKNSNVKLIKKGTTLLSFKLSIGKTAISGKDLYTNEAIAALKIKEEFKNQLIDKYLFFIFNQKIIDLESVSYKAFGKSLNSDYLNREIKIPFPPLEIQEKIVSEIEEIDKKEKGNDVRIENFNKNRQLQINSLFETERTEKLGKVCDIRSGGTPKTEVLQYWQNGKIQWLKSEVCNQDYVSSAKTFITQEGLDNSNARLFKPFTTLIALVGATKGKTSFLLIEAATNQNIAGLFPKNQKKLDPKFLYYSCISLYPIFFNLGKYKMISSSFIKEMKIYIPPIDVQREFIKSIESLESEINKLKQENEHLKIQKEEVLKMYL
ncbi:MAG: N-6 DNA methylase [Candidatus Cloacimonetes bacterium]|nr:N-6 DNA methylase [Candidatus Cloacimonadota bacterium]